MLRHYCWSKGTTRQLSKHFATYEFECSCDGRNCTFQYLNKELLNKLEKLREDFGEPIRVTSGFRCAGYQRALARKGYKTAKNSQHLYGNAVDIMPSRSNGHHPKRLRRFKKMADKIFSAMGTANTWIHVDIRDDKKRRWTY